MASDLPDVPGYVLTHLLGQGTFGVVFAAHSLAAPQRALAIKIFKRDVVVRTKDVLRVQREGRIGFELRHANIVEVHEIGEIDGRHFIVMDRVEGEQLRDRILRRFPEGEARLAEDPGALARELRIVARVCRAAGHAHRCNIIHRDIKPANILVRSDGHPFLIDFGLGRHLDGESTLTSTGVTVGSYFYMAPEQLDADVARIGPASDIYALGATLHHVCTGRVPFTATNANELRRRVFEEEVPPAPPGLPAGLERIWLRALEKQPQHRYRSAEEMADDLERVADGIAPRGRGTPIAVLRGWRSLSRRRATLLAASILALAVAAFVFWTQARDRDEVQAARLVENGQSALWLGQLETAAARFGEAARIAPRDAAPEIQMAAAYQLADRPAAAAEAVERARAKGFTPCPPAASGAEQYLTALYHVANADDARGIECFLRGIERDRRDGDLSRPEAHLFVARLLWRQERETEALEHLDRYLERVPKISATSLAARLHRLEIVGKPADALAELDAYMQADASADAPWMLANRGRLLLELERYDEARVALETVTGIAPDEGADWVALAICCHYMGDTAGAENACRIGLSLRPDLLTAHAMLAVLAIGRRAWDEAEQHFLQAGAGMSVSEIESVFDAQRIYERAMQADDEHDYRGAAVALRACLASMPEHLGALIQLGNDLWYDGKADEALPLLLRGSASLERARRCPRVGRDLFNRQFVTSDNELSLLTAIFGTTATPERLETARNAQVRIEHLIRTQPKLPATPMYNYAEALFDTQTALKDACRAREILDLRNLDGPIPDTPNTRLHIEAIRAACPR